MIRTYEIIEAGQQFDTVRARSAENAIRAARRRGTICASDYNCNRGDLVELEWTARATDDRGPRDDVATVTLTARAK